MLSLLLAIALPLTPDAPYQPLQPLPIGEIRPEGWILQQMTQDATTGMAGHFLELCPNYGGISWTMQNGNPGAGEMGGNWIDGFVRMAYLTDDPSAKEQADQFLQGLISVQEPDGYLGNHKPETRYQSQKTRELWSQSRIYMAMLAYYEILGDKRYLNAVEAATQNIMAHYGPKNRPFHLDKSDPQSKEEENVNSHSLMFIDVLEWLYRLTGKNAYLNFAEFLYDDFSTSDDVKTKDIQLRSLLEKKYPFFWHGVHTAEQIRVPLFLAEATQKPQYREAALNALEKLEKPIVPSGSIASDEGIMNHTPSPTQAYEYCATTELAASLESALQKTGDPKYADMVERDVFNAAQGARTPDGKNIAYLSSTTLPSALESHDIPYSGTRRHKLSPAHNVGGACCSANAVKILPYYVGNMWMKTKNGLAAVLYGPCRLSTKILGEKIEITEDTQYPFSDSITFEIKTSKPVRFPITLRIPSWAGNTKITTTGTVSGEPPLQTVTNTWKTGDKILVEFENPVKLIPTTDEEYTVNRGPLLFVLPWPSTLVPLPSRFKNPEFQEYNAVPKTPYDTSGLYLDTTKPFSKQTQESQNVWEESPLKLLVDMRTYDAKNKFTKTVTLAPMGTTILRFASFPLWPFDDKYFEKQTQSEEKNETQKEKQNP